MACLLCRPPTLPLVCCFAPYPPNPLPRRGRGRFFCFLMQGASPLASPAFNRLRHLQSLPLWYPVGGLPPALPSRRALTVPCGWLARFAARLPCLWFDFLPPSPQPPSRREGGDFLVYFAGGFAPGTPALNRLRHLQSLPLWRPEGGLPRRHWLDLPIRHSTGACLRHRQFAAKPTETLSYERCRQPRRGGTGGEELRRLRWSSPPGQGEPVPRGGKPPCAPRRTPQRQGL